MQVARHRHNVALPRPVARQHNGFSGLLTSSTKVTCDRLYNDTVALLNFNRDSYQPAGLAQAADHLKAAWEGLGYLVTEQIVPFKVDNKNPLAEPADYKNLIASVGPANAPRIIIGAHYDTKGNLPGADDNTASIAALTELMRRFSKYKPKLRHRIDFVAYTLEETGLHGSKHHAKWLHDMQIPVIGVISLDMLGYYDDKMYSQKYPKCLQSQATSLPRQGNFLAVVGTSKDWLGGLAAHIKSAGIPTWSHPNASAEMLEMMNSDYNSYIPYKLPAGIVTDTGGFRNPHYHKASDTPDKLKFDNIAKTVNGVYAWLLSVGNN